MPKAWLSVPDPSDYLKLVAWPKEASFFKPNPENRVRRKGRFPTRKVGK